MEKVINIKSTPFQHDFIYESRHFLIRLKEEILRSHRLQIPFLYLEVNPKVIQSFEAEFITPQQEVQQESIKYLKQILPDLRFIGELNSGGLGLILINSDLSSLEELNHSLNNAISETEFTGSTFMESNQPLFNAFFCSGHINRPFNPKEQLLITSVEATKVFRIHSISSYQKFAAHPKDNTPILKKLRQLFS